MLLQMLAPRVHSGMVRLAVGRALSTAQYPKIEGGRIIPPPTASVPDASSFLRAIGRNASAEAGRLPSWDALFAWNSRRMARAGVACRMHKYILEWAQRFRHGVEPYEIPPSGKAVRRAREARRLSAPGKKPSFVDLMQ